MALHQADKQLEERILKELRETNPSKLQENLHHLKQWISMQPHLPQNYDERMLVNFIRGCKHDMAMAKRKLNGYFTVRSLAPEFFTGRNPEIMREYFFGFPLPELTKEGLRVNIFKYRDCDASKLDLRNVAKLMFMLGDLRLIEDNTIAGDIFVFDVKHVKASHMPKIVNPILKKAIRCTEEAYPVRLKQIHLINVHPMVDAGVRLIKIFLSQTLKERFHVHCDVDTMFKYVPQEMLPSEYGGKQKTSNEFEEEWCSKLKDYVEYFKEQETVLTDETKRIASDDSPVIKTDDLFGAQGTFHKLNID